MEKINKSRYNTENTSILIISKSSGKTLLDYIGIYTVITLNDKFNILFQILYTLKCFEKIGLSHNDLHFGNIFIDELETPEERIYYISNDECVKIKIKYDVKIFDFDRGSIYHPAVERNFTLDNGDFCSTFGKCNKFQQNKDLSSFIYRLQLYENDVDIRNYLTTITTKQFRKSVSKKDYLSGPEITKGLKSISECIKSLIDEIKFNKIIGTEKSIGKNTGKIFTLPLPLKLTNWNPTSNRTHKSWNIPFSKKSVSNFLTDKYMCSVPMTIISNNIYENEFGKRVLNNHVKTLFSEYIKRKNIDQTYHSLFMTMFYVLCLPFVYKFDSSELKYFLYANIICMNDDENKDELDKKLELYVKTIDDIWNVFNGTLPINVLKM